jgi:hypothetical protein
MTMKFKPYLFLLLSIFLILSSCEEDFDITASYKDITIAYGLLDLNEDTTYVRINKAFLGDGNVLEMVEVEDSSVYVNGLDAYIEEWSNGNYLAAYQLDTMTIDNKDTGLFYNPYHLLYYGTFQVKQEMQYKLKIFVNGKEVSGNSNVVNDFSMSKPNAGPSPIKFTRGLPGSVEWESAKYGKRYEVLIRFNFRELMAGNPDTIYRAIDWFLGTEKSKETVGEEEMYSSYQNDAFYALLSDKTPYSDPSQEAMISQRFTTNVQFIISVGGDELNTYMEVNEPSNSIVQEKPDYTNLTNGLGLFSSRYRKVRDKKISLDTVDEIKKLNLKFVY